MLKKIAELTQKHLSEGQKTDALLATLVPVGLETLNRQVRSARQEFANEMAYRGAVSRLVKEATPNAARETRELVQALLIVTVA